MNLNRKPVKTPGGKRRIVRDVMTRGFTQRKAAKAVDTVFRLMREALSCHEPVELPHIGTLEVRIRDGRPKKREQACSLPEKDRRNLESGVS